MITRYVATLALLSTAVWSPVLRADDPTTEQAPGPSSGTPQETTGLVTKDLSVTVGKSLVVDSPVNIQRVSVANPSLAEAVAISPKELLVNGLAAGETTVIIWQQGGNRLFYDLTVRQSTRRIEVARAELARDLPGQDVSINYENDTAFISGTVKDLMTADRAVQIALSLGPKVVNLLHVAVPPVETQVLLKVRFADVDRKASLDLGMNLTSFTAFNFNPGTSISTGGSTAPNITIARKDINLTATITALQAKNLLEILAEPNVLAINGKTASFVAGGEFPYPTLQGGGAGLGAVTIAFREFGIRLQFTPTVTPRGTIRLQVLPEVSSLDFAHGLTFQGFAIPALSTRRVQTEIELESGQSFAIAGLLDNEMTDTMSKIPGLANIPLLGKLFTTKSISRQNSELLILVTPEIVRPVPQGQPVPEVSFVKNPKMDGTAKNPPQQPGLNVTGPVPNTPTTETMPVEQLQELRRAGQPATPPMPAVQFVPVPVPQTPSTQGGSSLPGPTGNSGGNPTPSTVQGTTGK
jgi:pilus assembly protein CpaC